LPSRENNGDQIDPTIRTLAACKSIDEVEELVIEWGNIFHEKVSHGLRRRKIDPDKALMVDALIANPGALSKPMLVSNYVGQKAYRALHDRMVQMTTNHPMNEMAFVTFISGDGETSHANTTIDLCESQRRVQATMRAISPDFFGITEFALFNSQGHPSGGQTLQRHEHVLVWGEGVVGKARSIAVKHQGRYSPNFTGARVIDVRRVSTDPVNLRRICWYIMKPPLKCMNWNPPKDGKPGFMNQSEKGDRFIRYVRLAQIRSMISFDAATFAGGDGIRIRREIITYLRSAVKSRAESADQTLHPDAVASFWVSLIQALRRDWNLPVIKTSR